MRRWFALTVLLAGPAYSAEPVKTAVFDIELIDMSGEAGQGLRDDETRRLDLASSELRKLLGQSRQIAVIDPSPQREVIAAKGPLNRCNGCSQDIAKDLGADLAVTGIVQKTSNLILSFAIEVRDVSSGRVIRGGQVDIRGNTDDTWLRGVRWVVKNRLLAEPLPIPP